MRKMSYVVNGMVIDSYAEARKLQPRGQLKVKFEDVVEKKKVSPNFRKVALAFYNQ